MICGTAGNSIQDLDWGELIEIQGISFLGPNDFYPEEHHQISSNDLEDEFLLNFVTYFDVDEVLFCCDKIFTVVEDTYGLENYQINTHEVDFEEKPVETCEFNVGKIYRKPI